ncbi:MAG: putative Ig domain-containing protein, partial [Acidobacteria bacterium]|nr:putative Ig domain-containing protein [Acidobacteriota bacterium]
PGLKLDAATGVLSGTPTMKGSYYISIRANGFGLCTGTRTYMLVIQ